MIINKCCIFINDDPYDQAVFTQALYDSCPETLCFTAPDGREALYMMKKEKLIPTYIFIESNLPKMNAVEFQKEMATNEILKEIPVIVHCISPQPHKLIELKESGAAAIYFRPYEYAGVCNMLNLYFKSEITAMQQN